MTYQGLPENYDEFSEVSFPGERLTEPGRLPRKVSSSKLLAVGMLLGAIFTLGMGKFWARTLQQSTTPVATPQIATKAVSVQTPQLSEIQQNLTTTGTVVAQDLLEVSAQLAGLQIRDVQVEAGDSVTQGQALAVLDDAILQVEIRQAQAALAQAQAQVQQQEAGLARANFVLEKAEDSFERYRSLFEQGAISREQLDTWQTDVMTNRELVQAAIANVQSAVASVTNQEAHISSLQLKLEQTLVRAPADGIIAERQANVGGLSSTGPLFKLIQGDVLELEVKLLQAQLAQVSIGTPVKVTSVSDRSLQLQGSVRAIEPVVDASSRQATVKIGLPADYDLRPGMFFRAEIITDQRQGIVVPADAVVFQANDQPVVYTLTPESTVQAIPVEIGARLSAQGNQPARIEILSGLTRQSQIVVEGTTNLQDGDRVILNNTFLK